MSDLESPRVAFITGAAQGIGLRTAEVLAAESYSLALNDLQPLDDLVTRLANTLEPPLFLVGDVSDETAVEGMAAKVMKRFGRIDVLVNNAGISSIGPAQHITAAEWRHVMDVNLLGPFLMSRAFGRIMLDQGSGSIVNVASVAGLLGVADRAAYQRQQAWPDRSHTYPRRRVGRPWCPCKRRASGLGQDAHGRCLNRRGTLR
jgi:NAD(P)-dependent dehydrogenase (short-subunit alcohol dehydrogenase family)